MTETPAKTQGKQPETLSDREMLEEIHGMLRRVCGLLDGLGINGRVTWMDMAGLARKMRSTR